jgi:hypothetical protein
MATYNAIKYNVDYGGFAGSLIPIASTTVSSSTATVSFTSGIDSTYKEYFFIFNSIHPSQDNADLSFQVSADGGSSYGVNITSSAFQAYHFENDSDAVVAYEASLDLAQSTSFQPIGNNTGNDNDQCISGYMTLFNPASTTFVKHFLAITNNANLSDISVNNYHAGYVNSTSAINAIQFKFDGGTIDSGIFQMFGVH